MGERTDVLNLGDIQGNILRPYGLDWAGYLFATVHDGEQGRAWLATLVPEVTTAALWGPDGKPEETLNIGISWRGLEALGVPREHLDSFPAAFRDGMAARASLLGDVGESAPTNWEPGLQAGTHLMLAVHARTEEQRDAKVQSLGAGIEAGGSGLAGTYRLVSQALRNRREHFGFADGFAQPAIEGSGHHHLPGQGTATRWGRWATLKAGEIVLGYEDEDGVRPAAPSPPLGDNGSYLVVRQLEQDVAAFRAFVAEAAGQAGLAKSAVAAKIIGRWPDGTPLVLSPDRPDPRIAGDKEAVNDFRYGTDPDGVRCPIGAHIRRANPRDDFGKDGRLTRRHRIIRRGMPYGPPFRRGTEDSRRGLMFLCFNADIERQFETIQARWCNDGDPFGLDTDRDLLSNRPRQGDEPPNKFTVNGPSPAFLVPPDKPFVVTKGGEYLFAPGISALRAIAGADW